MKSPRPLPPRHQILVLLCALFALAAFNAQAQHGQDIWSSAGVSANLNNNNNWTNFAGNSLPPTSGDGLIFDFDNSTAAAGNDVLSDNLTSGAASFTLTNLTFTANAPGYTITPAATNNGFTLGTTTPATVIIDNGASPIVIADPITLAATNQTISITGGSSLTLSGLISGPGNLMFNGGGNGILVLTNTAAAEGFTGATVVTNGVLHLGPFPNSAVGGLASNSSLTINNGATVVSEFNNALAGSAGTLGTLPVTINAGGILTSTGTVDSSHIRGILTLNGGTLADGGTANQAANGTWDLDDGVVVGAGTSAASLISALEVIPDQATNSATGLASGGTIFNVNVSGGVPYDLDISGTLINGTSIHDTGIIKLGNGIMQLDGVNTYTGATTISNGTLTINGNALLGGAAGNYAGAITNNGTLTYNATGSNNFTGVMRGTGALNVNNGILVLTAINAFSGTTTVNNGGELNEVVGGSGQGPVSITGGGTMGVNVNAAGGHWNLTNNLTFVDSSPTLVYNFTQPPSSTTAPLQVTGNVTFGNTLGLVLNGVVTVTPGTYPLLTWTGTSSGVAPTTANSAFITLNISGLTTATIVQSNNTISLVVPAGGGNSVTWDIAPASSGVWDTTTHNWVGGALYKDGDFVNFGDTFTGPSPVTVTLNTTVNPGGVTFANNVENYTLTGTGAISGANGVTLGGTGTLTINNVNQYAGNTTVSGGALVLDFNALANHTSSSQSNNIIGTSSPLVMNGGTLTMNPSATLTNTETFASATFPTGSSVINVPQSGSISNTLSLGAISSTLGAVVEYVGPATIGSGSTNVPPTGTINTGSSGGGGAGLFGGNGTTTGDYATVGLYDWAATVADPVNGNDIVGGSQVSGFYTAFAAGNNTLAGNADFTAATEGSHNTDNIGSIRFNVAGGCIWSPGSVCTTGGFLVTPNVGAANILIQGTAGEVEPSRGGASAAVIWQNNILGFFIWNVNNYYNDAKSGAGSLVLAGIGTVEFNFPGTYTGTTYVDGGAIAFLKGNYLGAAATGARLTLNGGTIMSAATLTLDNSGANIHPISLGAQGGGLAAAGGTTLTVDGVISAAGSPVGPLVIGIPASAANGNTAGLLPGTGAGTANTTAVNATGTVFLTGANTYTGGTVLDTGILKITPSSLGTGGVTFNGGTLQWTANTPDISQQTVTLNANGGILDVNGNTVSLANGIGNGGSGALNVVSSASGGTLVLNGVNTFTGLTTVNIGAALSGTGSLAGSVTTASGGTFGLGGTVGGSLTLQPGASVSLTATTTPQSVVGAVTFNGNTAVAYLPVALATGHYTILSAPAGITGTLVFTGATGPGASAVQDYSLTIGATTITLNVSAPVSVTTWTGSGNWSNPANWNNGVPNSPAAAAIFGTGSSQATLDMNETAGIISLTNTSSTVIVTNGVTATTLTLDNSGDGAAISVSAGTNNAVKTAILLNDTLKSVVSGGDSLTLSGNITSTSTSETVFVTGAGKTIISGVNTYGPAAGTVGTSLTGGATLNVANNSALSTGDLSSAASTIQAGVAGLTLANNIVLGTGTSYIDNNGGLNVTLNGAISGGGTLDLTNSTGTGTGKVTLAPGSSYSGGTVINSNVIASVSADTSLGAAPGGASANNILFNNGGDLLGVGNPVTLNANRGLGIGSPSVVNTATATAFLDASGALQIGGTVAGAGNAGTNNLTINGEGGTGTVELLGVGTFNGITTISNGTLEIGNALALQNSTLNYTNGGILTFDGTNGVTAATIGAIMGAKNLALANSTNGPVALSLEGINSSTTYAGGFIDSGAGSSIIKNGSGTLTLTGASTITGATTVNNGTLLINPGGALNCGGVNMPGAGETFEVNGGSLTSSGAGVLDDTLGGMTFLVNGGTATFNADLGVVSGQNTTYFIHVNTNGTLNATSISLGRSGDSLTTYPTTGATTLGLYNSGGTINVGNLNMSTNALDNSSTVAEMDSGILNVTNGAYVGNVNGGRWSILDIKGGTFTALDTNVGLSVGIPDGSSLSLVLLQGGTTTAGIVSMGNAAVAGGQYVLQQTGGTLYVGAGGISNVLSTNSGSYLNTSNILSGGILGATTNWSSITPFLFSGSGTIQTANSNNTPWNITLTGGANGTGGFTKMGAGTLTMGGGGPNNGLGNAWAGPTVVEAGTLALVTTNSVAGDLTATTSLTIASNTTVDVTGLTDVTLHIGDPAVSQSTAQTLTGNGSVNGNVKIGVTGTLSPGAAATSLGNLTITGNLTNGDGISGGGAILMLVDHPFKGVTNSSVSAQSIWITNNLAVSGTNVSTLTVNQGTNSLQTGDVFQLFNIAGNAGLATARNLVLKLPAKTPNGTITYVWNTNSLAVNGQLILTTGAPVVSPIPTNITFSVAGNQLTISWPANQTGWTLQTNSNLINSNGWVAVAGSTSVNSELFTITTNTPQLYYRLEHAPQ